MRRAVTGVLVGLAIAATLLVRAQAGGARPLALTPGTERWAEHDAARRAVATYRAALARVDVALDSIGGIAQNGSRADIERAFLAARGAYKGVEWLAEHYTPLTASALNGPAIDRPDEENPRIIIKPTGLQVMETLVYRDSLSAPARDSLAVQARIARVLVRRLRERIDETTVTDEQLFDAGRLEVARLVSLGISGFDTPLAASAMPETAEAIAGVRDAMSAYKTPVTGRFIAVADSAIAYLRAHPQFETFDRFEFIVDYANPLAAAIVALRDAAGVNALDDRRAFSAHAVSVFDRNAFDPHAFAPPGAPLPGAAWTALGERLFFDVRLSGPGDRSCATCHAPSKAFADGLRTPSLLRAGSTSNVPAEAPTARNTPTLLNAGLQASAFADGHVAFLEDQIVEVLENRAEMNGAIAGAARLLTTDPAYRALVTELPRRTDQARTVQYALAAYVRSLSALDSRFDRAIRGERHAITDIERLGFNTFMGKAKCGSCHFAPLFNGTVPPGYTETEIEVIGTPRDANIRILDPDRGAERLSRSDLHRRAFKTPTVRNASLTAPYMHNGVFRTLEETIDFYDGGGGAGHGLMVPNQTLPSDSLRLTALEKRALVSFIESLTDRHSPSPSS